MTVAVNKSGMTSVEADRGWRHIRTGRGAAFGMMPVEVTPRALLASEKWGRGRLAAAGCTDGGDRVGPRRQAAPLAAFHVT